MDKEENAVNEAASNEPTTVERSDTPAQDDVAHWKAQARKWETQSRTNFAELEKLKSSSQETKIPEDYEALKAENRRFKTETISSKYSLPERIIQLLEGETLEELEADAKKWATDLGLTVVDKDDSTPDGKATDVVEEVKDVKPDEDAKTKLFLKLQGKKTDTSKPSTIKTKEELKQYLENIQNQSN